jgi:folylpolyglutamate synthase
VLIFNCTHGRSAQTLLEALQTRAPALPESSAGNGLTDRGTWFDEVIFCSNTTYSSGVSKGGQSASRPSFASLNEADSQVALADLTSVAEGPDDKLVTQHSLKDAFLSLNPSFPPAKIHVLPSIEAATQALRSGRDEGAPLHVLVTGSLHLVGGVMDVVGLGVH